MARALQAPIYALCAQERLSSRDGQPWTIAEASYVPLNGRRGIVAVVKASDSDMDRDAILSGARVRLLAVLDGMARGDCAPRPYDTMICRSCAFPAVCRKEYAADE